MKREYLKPTFAKSSVRLQAATAQPGGQVTGPPSDPSDRRLKTDIVRVGILMSGIPLYRFRYIWGDEVFVGVMAQDVLRVLPDVVLTDAAGFMRVDYAALGTRMMRWDEWQTTDKGHRPISAKAEGSVGQNADQRI